MCFDNCCFYQFCMVSTRPTIFVTNQITSPKVSQSYSIVMEFHLPGHALLSLLEQEVTKFSFSAQLENEEHSKKNSFFPKPLKKVL